MISLASLNKLSLRCEFYQENKHQCDNNKKESLSSLSFVGLIN